MKPPIPALLPSASSGRACSTARARQCWAIWTRMEPRSAVQATPRRLGGPHAGPHDPGYATPTEIQPERESRIPLKILNVDGTSRRSMTLSCRRTCRRPRAAATGQHASPQYKRDHRSGSPHGSKSNYLLGAQQLRRETMPGYRRCRSASECQGRTPVRRHPAINSQFGGSSPASRSAGLTSNTEPSAAADGRWTLERRPAPVSRAVAPA